MPLARKTATNMHAMIGRKSMEETPCKKRRTKRANAKHKTALCKRYDRPEGCPYPDCRYAHGSEELQGEAITSVAAQRQLIRDQVEQRQKEQYISPSIKNQNTLPATMVERYYTQLFALNVMGNESHDISIQMHSNRLCMTTLAPSHPVFQETILSVDFGEKLKENKVNGKKKKGGLFLIPTTILCRIRCHSGRVYEIPSCIRGALLEINERLVDQPELLKHPAEGYLVVVQPKVAEIYGIQQNLVPMGDYELLRSNLVSSNDSKVAAGEESECRLHDLSVAREIETPNPLEV
ncbi:unnamed protein product [Albugo candida]|uniref:C3H1-type domain-containing protein n=1 Tax=Albugo candida TaxID=65357 RepID=A0A024G3R4_9STRA|nr:unnamed protein product [Albugo candida]|eukprot:CCI41217.1 unnamed protein product [Albugo candida]